MVRAIFVNSQSIFFSYVNYGEVDGFHTKFTLVSYSTHLINNFIRQRTPNWLIEYLEVINLFFYDFLL